MEKRQAISQQPGQTRTQRPPPHKGGGGFWLFLLGLGFIGLAVFAMPTCVLVLFGMVPSIVAYVVDRGRRPMLAFTIGPLNLAGLMPYLLEVWTGQAQMQIVARLLTDVYVWLVIYLSAGAGWLVFMAMPKIVAFVLERSVDGRKAKLKAQQGKLREDWGSEVGGGEDPI